MTWMTRWFVTAVVVATVLSVLPGQAQQPPQATEERDSDDSERSLREQTIYIPYENLRKTFEKEGRGVFLPYERFQELWESARAAKSPRDEGKPRKGAMITAIRSDATVRRDVVEVRAELQIELLGKGWHEVALRLADAAITEARIGEEPARLVSEPSGGYRLLIENPSAESTQVTVQVTYAKGIQRAPGENSVSFQAPQAPVNRWTVRIPESGVKVDIHPMIAVTEASGERAAEEAGTADSAGAESEGETPEPDAKASDAETVILAFVGAAPEVRIAWTPKAEGATGLAALATVQTQQRVFIGEGVTRTHTRLAYSISRAELGQLAILVPGDQKVVNVFDANVRQWAIEADGDRQRITVQLFEPAEGSQNVIVELEKFNESDKPAGDADSAATDGRIAMPVVEAVGVGRQQGVVVVQVGEGYRAEASGKMGLVQIDAGDLPPELAGTEWTFSYRYGSVPYQLELDVEKIEPRIIVDSLAEAKLEPERFALAVTAIYNVERAGVFRLQMDLPDGFTVRTVQGRAVSGCQPALVDSHHLVGEDQRRLVVSLSRKAIGRVGLFVFLDRRLDDPELRTPTGAAARLSVPLPQIPADTVERATGRLIVYAPESLRVNPVEVSGLRAVAVAEALAGLESSQGGANGVLAYVFGDEAPALTIEAERRKPQVTVRQLLIARVEDGVARYELRLLYDVLYSGIKSIRIDVPEAVAGLLRNRSKTIRDQQMVPAPEDLTEGCVAWNLTGTTELIGHGRIDLTWETKIEELEPGRSVTIEIPRIRPMGVDRAWGQIVLTKAETIDLSQTEETSGLRPIDPQHDLIDGIQVEGAVRAFEFHDDWTFQVAATRYDLEDIKQTSIGKSLLRMVLTRSGKTVVQALYRIRSSNQRLELRMPADCEFDADPRIDGQSVRMELGAKQSYFIPLLNTQEDKPFLLELRYTLSDSQKPIAWPEFPAQPAVQKVYLCVYLPEEIDLLETSGPWTREFHWRLDGLGNFEPLNSLVLGGDTFGAWLQAFVEAQAVPNGNRYDAVTQRLMEWVCESEAAPETLKTDGRLFVFSTLRPSSPANDGLRLYRVHQNYLNGAVLLVVLLVGALLLPAGAGRRLCAVGSLAIALLFVAIFWPLAVWNLCDRTLALPLLIVFAVWTVQFFAWTLPRRLPHWLTARSARPAESPPSERREAPVDTEQAKRADADDEEGPNAPGDARSAEEDEGGQSHA